MMNNNNPDDQNSNDHNNNQLQPEEESTTNIELDADEELEWEEWKPDQISFGNHMIAGSLAGLAEHVCLFPMDTIKTHIQCQKCGSVTPFQTWSYTIKMIHQEGLFRLWRGVTAMFAGCIPAHAAYFSVFESMKIGLHADQQNTHTPFRAALCGATASVSHDLLITPFDTIKQRMQLGYYQSTLQCFRNIVSTEGIQALYLSFPTTLAMNIPHGCFVVAINESAKKILNPSGKYNISMSLLSGCIAGGVAAMITTPLDVIKTRLQTQDLLPCTLQKTMNHAAANTAAATATTATPSILHHNVVTTKEAGSMVSKTIHHNVTTFCLENVNKTLSTAPATATTSTPAAAAVPSSSGASTAVRGYATLPLPQPMANNPVITPMNGSVEGNLLWRNIQQVKSIVSRIYSTEGLVGFYRGAVPRMLTQAPAVAISWTVYEGLKSLLVGNQSQTAVRL